MKTNKYIENEKYNITINKSFFLDKWRDKIGNEKALHLFHISSIIYKRIIDTCLRLDECEKSEIKKLVLRLTHLEYRLQKLWGFVPNKKFHRYWKMPHNCNCEFVIDYHHNAKRFYKIDCKIHSIFIEEPIIEEPI